MPQWSPARDTLSIRQVEGAARTDVRRFIEVPHLLYSGHRNWVPPLRAHAAVVFDRRRHPFYEHSDAAFFIAIRDDRAVGRIAAFELRPYNRTHNVRQVSFTLFDCADDPEAAAGLFAKVFEWGASRKLDCVVGPRGLSAFDGYGVLVDGFERRQLMTMTSYNGPWYSRLVETQGFRKEVDFVSYELTGTSFRMPDGVRRAAERAAATMQVVRHRSNSALLRTARQIGQIYNDAFCRNWEYYPLTSKEIDFLVEQVRPLSDRRLMSFLAAEENIVGFVLAFADVSAALQRARGRLTPLTAVQLLFEKHRTRSAALNGAAVLPQYQGRGGNALMYVQIESVLRAARFERVELPQVAETAARMRRDIERLGGVAIKTHRVYTREL